MNDETDGLVLDIGKGRFIEVGNEVGRHPVDTADFLRLISPCF